MKLFTTAYDFPLPGVPNTMEALKGFTTLIKPLFQRFLSKIKDAGTAAACNTGTEAGQIPVIGEGGKLNEALIPQQTLTTDNVNEGKKNLYYTNERVTNYLQDTANTFVMDGGNA